MKLGRCQSTLIAGICAKIQLRILQIRDRVIGDVGLAGNRILRSVYMKRRGQFPVGRIDGLPAPLSEQQIRKQKQRKKNGTQLGLFLSQPLIPAILGNHVFFTVIRRSHQGAALYIIQSDLVSIITQGRKFVGVHKSVYRQVFLGGL